MDIKIHPHKLNGTVKAIASKSYAHRILIASALCDTPTTIKLNGISKDIKATINAIEALGAKVKVSDNTYTVYPIEKVETPFVDCGESGTTARLILPIAAALYKEGTITGSGTLLSRPFNSLCEVLRNNGCNIDRNTLPITFNGKFRAGEYYISGSESSQYISALLFTIPLLQGKSEIHLTSKLESSGYVDITRDILKRFGVSGEYTSYGNEKYISPTNITVEGDWSNAAFWLSAGCAVDGLNYNSLQRDKCFLQVKDMLEVDVSDIPDLVPILAVNAMISGRDIRLYNATRLKLKESNRIKSVEELIKSLGGNIITTDSELMINGTSGLVGGEADSFNDHRIVMSAAIASCYCKKEVIIRNAEAVEKSYSEFFKDFESLGGKFNVL